MLVLVHRGPLNLAGLYLRPGANQVDDSDWEAVKGLPAVRHMLGMGENGGMTLGDEPKSSPSPKPAPKPEPMPEPEPVKEEPKLVEMKASELVLLVEKMGLDELDELEASEERKTVLKAIEARRKELMGDED